MEGFVLRVSLVFLGNILTIQFCIYLVHLCFYGKIILHHLDIPLPQEDGFSKIKNSYIQSANCSICDNYSGNASEIWINGDRFYTTEYANFGSGRKPVSTPLDFTKGDFVVLSQVNET